MTLNLDEELYAAASSRHTQESSHTLCWKTLKQDAQTRVRKPFWHGRGAVVTPGWRPETLEPQMCVFAILLLLGYVGFGLRRTQTSQSECWRCWWPLTNGRHTHTDTFAIALNQSFSVCVFTRGKCADEWIDVRWVFASKSRTHISFTILKIAFIVLIWFNQTWFKQHKVPSIYLIIMRTIIIWMRNNVKLHKKAKRLLKLETRI